MTGNYNYLKYDDYICNYTTLTIRTMILVSSYRTIDINKIQMSNLNSIIIEHFDMNTDRHRLSNTTNTSQILLLYISSSLD